MNILNSHIYKFVKCYGRTVSKEKYNEIQIIEKKLEILSFDKDYSENYEDLIKQIKRLTYDLYLEIPHRFPIGSGG